MTSFPKTVEEWMNISDIQVKAHKKANRILNKCSSVASYKEAYEKALKKAQESCKKAEAGWVNDMIQAAEDSVVACDIFDVVSEMK